MTLKELASRVEALEDAVRQLREQAREPGAEARRWWRSGAGRFANDPVFEEIVRLGREYRDGTRPARRGKRQARDAHP